MKPFLNINDALVVAAHPDDEILGCGATLARLKNSGCHIHLILLGEGPTARSDRDARLCRTGSQSEAENAAARIGIESIDFIRLPDNRFDTVPFLEIVKHIEKIAASLKPEIVFTHFGGDINIDHTLTYRAVMTAFRPLPGCEPSAILSFEVPSSTEYSIMDAHFHANVFFNVTGYVEQKINALKEYESEMRPWPHPRSFEYVRDLARIRGAQCGHQSAEAFMLSRIIN